MSRYDPNLRVMVLEADDEAKMRFHFANARRAWVERREVVDSRFHYTVDKDGVWGGSVGVARRDYFWPKEVLEAARVAR